MESANLTNILREGTAMPYLALFDKEGVPVMNTITGIPLGAYISKFTYKTGDSKNDEVEIVLETGDPDIVDIEPLQDKKLLIIQWGYVYSDGTSISSPIKGLEITDFSCNFNETGTHATIKCKDIASAVSKIPPHKPNTEEDKQGNGSNMTDYLDDGCGRGIGIVIEKFNYR